jgi:alanyl-tRNA synthetase
VKYLELRELLTTIPKYPGAKKLSHSPVVNGGFPGKFNLSFSEPVLEKLVGNFLNFPHDIIWSTIQPVIRDQDFRKEIISRSKQAHTYLGLFDMADVAGCITLANCSDAKFKKASVFTIKAMWDFLTKELGFSPQKIYVKVFEGNSIERASRGKYQIKKVINKDELSIKTWQELGLSPANLIYDDSRDSLLAPNLYLPAPWGYRSEIFINIGAESKPQLLDVGTTEFLRWKPIFEANEITNLVPWESALVLSVVGVERILMAKNNFANISECDHIYPLYQKILADSGNKDQYQAFVMTEATRVLHRVFSDCGSYANLSRHRKKLLKMYVQQLHKGLLDFDLPLTKIRTYLELNAKLLQKAYPELKRHIKSVNEEILNAIKRRK